MQADIRVIISAISARSAALNNLTEGIKTPGKKREILDALLDFCGLEKTEESRYAAYIRIAKMWEDNLINYLGKTGFSKEAKENILKKAYSFVADYHGKLHENLLAEIEEKELLTPFYREVFRGAREVGITFNAFYRAWDSYLIRKINPDLEAQF